MYQLCLKIIKLNEKVNTIFISPVTFTSYFDVALNKRNAGLGCVFCVWLFSCNNPMPLAVRKRFRKFALSVGDQTSIIMK